MVVWSLRAGIRVAACLVLAAVSVGATAPTRDPGRVLAQIAAARADGESAVMLEGFRLRTGLAVVHLDEGVLVPATPVGDRPMEFVFVGSGRLEFEPPDDVEAGQLELFTGSRTLDEGFTSAVFVVALDSAADALVQLPSAAGDRRVARAARILEDWHSSTERKMLNVESRMFSDAAGDPMTSGYFCGSFEGVALGTFLYVVDPAADEQVSVGQFVRPELTRSERRRVERHLQREQRQGKLIGMESEDIGRWNTWVSMPFTTTSGDPVYGSTGVEPTRYTLDVALSGKKLELEGSARLELRVLADGLRVVILEMDPNLDPRSVATTGGVPLTYLRTRDELAVVLPEPASADSEIAIEISYGGQTFDRLAADRFAQRSTLGWYPHAGNIDRATYDVRVRWPEHLALFGSGRVIDQGNDGAGYRWQRRLLERKSLGFSFEVGGYQVRTLKVGHVDVIVAIDRIGDWPSSESTAEIAEWVRSSLVYFEQVFGPYPLDHLEVVSTPRDISQGLLGFITLSATATYDWSDWGEILGIQDVRTVIAHEVAHQWWGNLVGWRSYRDQWISEAMATYSALLYSRNRLPQVADEAVRIGPTQDWQTALLRTTLDGRTVESLGPVTLGSRLYSTYSAAAYHAIVYKKGAVVLDMLAHFFTEEVFLRILREIVRVAGDGLISTRDFISLVERLGGTDLTWFADQYVFGTGLPEIDYSYTIESSGEHRWTLAGTVRQRAPLSYRFRVVESPAGSLDVRRDSVRGPDPEGWVLVVPFQVGLWAPEQAHPAADAADPRRVVRGRVVLSGDERSFRIDLDRRPEILWLDYDRRVFGRFFSVDREPRRTALRDGLDLVAAGRLDEAEDVLFGGLGAEVSTDEPPWRATDESVEHEGELLAASIHIELARLDLDMDRDSDAGSHLAEAYEVLRLGDRWRFEAQLLALEARRLIRAGEVESAYKSLRKGLVLRRGLESAEGFALLAIAARATGHLPEFKDACRLATQRGVDVAPLECP